MGTDGGPDRGTSQPPAGERDWRPDRLVVDIARLEYGDRLDHITPDPQAPLRWLVTLKDGTTDVLKINCTRG